MPLSSWAVERQFLTINLFEFVFGWQQDLPTWKRAAQEFETIIDAAPLRIF